MSNTSSYLTSSSKYLGLPIHICHMQEQNKAYITGGIFRLTLILVGKCKQLIYELAFIAISRWLGVSACVRVWEK